MNTKVLRFTLLSIVCFLLVGTRKAGAQNLILNGDITAGAANWTTSCVNVECYGFETSYGGPSATNHVAEIDDEACMHQDVCAFPGASYTFSIDASRRTGGGPNPCISHIKITGLDASLATVATYVDMDYTRTNTVFALTPVTGIPVINVATGSGVVYLRVTLTDNTPGYLTLGMIVDNISLVMTSPPAVLTGGATSTCQNTPLSFSVSGLGPTGYTYAWDFGTGATPATSTSATPSASWSTPGVKTVSVVVGNGVCFTAAITYTVTVNPAVHTVLFDTTCYHVPYVFNGVSIYTSGTYNDTVVNPTGCDTIHTLNLYVRPVIVTDFYHTMCNGSTYAFNGHNYNSSGTYTDTFLNAGGCDSATVLHLTVNPIPARPGVTSVSYCQYDIASALSVTGTALTWYGPGVTAGYTIAPNVATTVAGTTVYYVTQTLLGCTSDSATINVTVKPKPAEPAVADTAYCQFQQVPALHAAGSALQWYNAATGGTNSAVAPVPSTNVPGTYSWYVSQVVDGCESDRSAIGVTVIPAPVFDIIASKYTICLADTMSLYYAGTGSAGDYLWNIEPGDSVAGGSITTPSILLKFNRPGKNRIYLTVKGIDGMCSAIDTVTILVDTAAVAQINIPAGACLGDTTILALAYHSDNAASYLWRVDDTLLAASHAIEVVSANANSGGPYYLSWNKAGQHVIRLNTISAGGCRSGDVYDTVQVNRNPNSAFTYKGKWGALCIEDSVLFMAVENGNQYYYVWSPSADFNNINEPNTWGRVNEKENKVSLMVSDAYGCKSTTTMVLDADACCSIFLPNAFTPGAKTANNVFRPLSKGYHRFHQFRISNRWGQTVYESTTQDASWDGTYNDIPQDVGVYYYFLKYDCGGNTMIQKGDVTLVR